MALLSKGFKDEVFVSHHAGVLVRIWELIDNLNLNPEPIHHVPTSKLQAMRRSDLVSGSHLREMTTERRDEPIIVALLGDELWVIDGNHRLARREQDGLGETAIVFVPPEVLARYVDPWP